MFIVCGQWTSEEAYWLREEDGYQQEISSMCERSMKFKAQSFYAYCLFIAWNFQTILSLKFTIYPSTLCFCRTMHNTSSCTKLSFNKPSGSRLLLLKCFSLWWLLSEMWWVSGSSGRNHPPVHKLSANKLSDEWIDKLNHFEEAKLSDGVR